MEGMNPMNKLEILYEDNHIIVVVKPCNVLSQSDKTKDVDMLTLIKAYLKEKYQKKGNVYLGLVHRLDRPVSGVMVFAKTSKAASRLSEQVRNHTLKKKYLAIVHGTALKEEDTFIDYLKKDENQNTKVVKKEEGKYAELSYHVLDWKEEHNLTLVSISLKTGRHHQIRVQFASRGHSLFGDQRYGIKDGNQIALHAYYLSFLHPITKEEMVFQKYPKSNGVWKYFL